MPTAASTPEKSTVTEEFRRVPIRDVKLASNVRKEVGDVRELADSIKAVGILQPLIVTLKLLPGGTLDHYVLVAGYRRLAAAKLAKLEEVPVMVRVFTDPERLEAQLIENLQRKDIEPVEEGKAMQQLLDLGRSKEQLAKRIGRTTELVAQRLALLGLPTVAVDALNQHKITIEGAVALTKLTDHPEKIADVVKHNRHDIKWGVDQALREISRDKRQAESLAKLAETGVKTLPMKGYSLPDGCVGLGDSYGRVKMATAAHAKFDCHAATTTDQGEIVYLCTNPKNHKGLMVTGSSNISESEKKRRAKEAAEKKIARAAADVRVEFIRGLVKKTTVARSAQLFIIAQLLETVQWDAKRRAAELLGMPPAKDKFFRYNSDLHDAFRAVAGKDDASMFRAALAAVLALGEGTLDGHGLHGDAAIASRYLDFLKQNGYKLTAWEKEQLAEAKDEMRQEAKEASEALAKVTKRQQQDPLFGHGKDRPVARPAGG